MLRTEKYTQANEDWEEIDAVEQTWMNWNKIYRAAARKKAIKTKATGGKDLFGTSNEATEKDTNPPW